MGRFSPDVGPVRRPYNALSAGLASGLTSVGDLLDERRMAARRQAEQELARQEGLAQWERQQAADLAREERGAAREDSRFTRQTQAEIDAENRAVARADAQRSGEANRLAEGLRKPFIQAAGNADAAFDAGEYDATESLIASGDPGLLRQYTVERTLEPRRDARELKMAEAKAKIEARYRPQPQRATPTPDRIQLKDGSYAEVLPNGVIRPLRMPDGSPVQGKVPGATGRITEGQRKAGTFLLMAEDAVGKLDKFGAPSIRDAAAGNTPFIGNLLMSGGGQQRQQAAYQLADAWLRFTSGAAVPEKEVERYAKTFTPMLGDDPATLKTKTAARQKILQALRSASQQGTSPDQDDLEKAADEIWGGGGND